MVVFFFSPGIVSCSKARRNIWQKLILLSLRLANKESMKPCCQACVFQTRRGPFYYQTEPLAKGPTISDWQSGTGCWHLACFFWCAASLGSQCCVCGWEARWQCVVVTEVKRLHITYKTSLNHRVKTAIPGLWSNRSIQTEMQETVPSLVPATG